MKYPRKTAVAWFQPICESSESNSSYLLVDFSAVYFTGFVWEIDNNGPKIGLLTGVVTVCYLFKIALIGKTVVNWDWWLAKRIDARCSHLQMQSMSSHLEITLTN